MTIKKYCTKPGCRDFAIARSSRCELHQPVRTDDRGSSSSRGYGAEWQKIRKSVLARDPVCQRCRAKFANVVHHLDHDQTNNDFSNLEGLCRECHEKHHNRKR